MLLVCDRKVALLRRSVLVTGDAGSWHCVTGFVEDGVAPRQQALTELEEEAGISDGHGLERLTQGCVLLLPDPRGGPPWRVHTFVAHVRSGHLALNWEHEAYRWVKPDDLSRVHPVVDWLGAVVEAAPLRVEPAQPAQPFAALSG